MWSVTPRSHVQGLAPRPLQQSAETRSSPELSESLCNCCQKPLDHYQQFSWPQIRQKCPSWYSPYSALTNHLMPPFQHKFSLSWSYTNWLSSVAKLCPTLCNPMDCSTPGFSVHHQLLQPTQTHVHSVGDATQASHPLSSPFSSHLQSFPASGSFPMSRFFASGG